MPCFITWRASSTAAIFFIPEPQKSIIQSVPAPQLASWRRDLARQNHLIVVLNGERMQLHTSQSLIVVPLWELFVSRESVITAARKLGRARRIGGMDDRGGNIGVLVFKSPKSWADYAPLKEFAGARRPDTRAPL